jgi:hypothetical protein
MGTQMPSRPRTLPGPGSLYADRPNLTSEMTMNAKQLFLAVLATIALPLSAQAAAQQDTIQLASAQATYGSTMGRADVERIPLYGEVHPVELQKSETKLTREQVKRELALYGAAQIGA